MLIGHDDNTGIFILNLQRLAGLVVLFFKIIRILLFIWNIFKILISQSLLTLLIKYIFLFLAVAHLINHSLLFTSHL